ncbi:MAG TPA: DNA-binding response regulator [Gammaproteobacteria bacterium]|nr:DNA-binding response regulator [Gammaproteobacteria bacterium]
MRPRVLIVDDEAPARARLMRWLMSGEQYEVAGEAEDGLQAIAAVQQDAPDIVLLDIQMPGMNGLEVAGHLSKLDVPPALIFTTAFDEYALQAFEANAVDYLLKPISEEKLATALQKAAKPNRLQLEQVASINQQDGHRTHLSVRVRGGIELVAIADVLYFQADQKYVTIRHKNGSMLTESSLKSLESEFNEQFFRIHRNALVSKNYIAGVEKPANGGLQLKIKGVEERLSVSRRHESSVRRLLRSLGVSI